MLGLRGAVRTGLGHSSLRCTSQRFLNISPRTKLEKEYEMASQTKTGALAELFFYQPRKLVVGFVVGSLGLAGCAYLYFEKLDNEHPMRKTVDSQLSSSAKIAGSIPVSVITAGFSVLAAVVTWNMAKLRLQYRVQDRVINMSINSIRNGILCMRTIAEKDIASVFVNNPGAANVVLNAARTTPKNQPFLQFPKEHTWFIMNAITNSFSSAVNPGGYILPDLKIPHKTEWYRFALTFEKDARKGRKLRVLAASEPFLRKINSMPRPTLETAAHKQRWEMLCQMGKQLTNNQPNELPQILGRAEVIYPTGCCCEDRQIKGKDNAEEDDCEEETQPTTVVK